MPRTIARRLKARAVCNHRSLQGELLAILTEAVESASIDDLAALVSRLGVKTPAESAAMICRSQWSSLTRL